MSGPAHQLERRAKGRVGTTLRGKYRIERVLGAGGMATVYEAVHRNGHRVAIKVLHPELSLRGDVCARFLREGYVANRVGHPGAVRVMDDDVAEDGSAFLVMELLAGETLRARCRRLGGRLPEREVLALGRELLDVLGAAHAAGIVHRDVKPDNLFLTTDRVLKVLDFGIARIEDDGGAMATVTGTRLGTPAFMPPELALGRTEGIDGRTDLWSVGATFFQLLSGQIVHDAPTSAEIMVRAATVPARSLAAATPDVPAAVVAVVDRALAFAPEGRWPDARAMARALEDAYAAAYGEPIASFVIAGLPDASTDARSIDAEAETVDASAPTDATRPDSAQRPTVRSSSAGPPEGTPGSPTLSGAATRSGAASTIPGAATRSGVASTIASPSTELGQGRPRATPRMAVLVLGLLVAGAGAVVVRGRRAAVPAPSGSAAAVPAVPATGSPCPAKMVLIPGGSFQMGDAEGRPDERPVHRVEVAAFCLDVDEVTVGAYAGCVESRGCSPVPLTVERPDLGDADRLFESTTCNPMGSPYLSHPMNCVDHAAATRYCASLGQRLPTEEEWEYAARGGDEQRRYPWGNEDPDPTRLNACDHACWELFDRAGHPWGHMFDTDDGFPRSAPVGRFRAGDSRWGVHDLAGNVGEWTSSAFCPYDGGGSASRVPPQALHDGGSVPRSGPQALHDGGSPSTRPASGDPSARCASPHRVYRGGGWPAVLRTTVQAGRRFWGPPTTRDTDLGFRCAKGLDDRPR